MKKQKNEQGVTLFNPSQTTFALYNEQNQNIGLIKAQSKILIKSEELAQYLVVQNKKLVILKENIQEESK